MKKNKEAEKGFETEVVLWLKLWYSGIHEAKLNCDKFHGVILKLLWNLV